MITEEHKVLLLQDQDLRSPLHAAAFLGDVRIMDLLIESGTTTPDTYKNAVRAFWSYLNECRWMNWMNSKPGSSFPQSVFETDFRYRWSGAPDEHGKTPGDMFPIFTCPVLVTMIASDSFSWQTRVDSHVVFCPCSPSTLRFNILCILRCSSAQTRL